MSTERIPAIADMTIANDGGVPTFILRDREHGLRMTVAASDVSIQAATIHRAEDGLHVVDHFMYPDGEHATGFNPDAVDELSMRTLDAANALLARADVMKRELDGTDLGVFVRAFTLA